MVLGLIILGVIAVGVETDIDRSLIDKSNYLKPSLLGWQLIYILPVAILTNDFFLSGFWMRTFASRTDKDLWIGVSLASLGVLIILTLVGVAGLLAAWSGAYTIGDEENGSLALFLLLEETTSMGRWRRARHGGFVVHGCIRQFSIFHGQHGK
jgi:hypothetical protein